MEEWYLDEANSEVGLKEAAVGLRELPFVSVVSAWGAMIEERCVSYARF